MKSKKAKLFGYAIAAVILYLIWSNIYIVRVVSDSMSPAYCDGEYLLSLNAKWVTLKGGDVVTFKNKNELLIKRIAPISDPFIYVYYGRYFAVPPAGSSDFNDIAVRLPIPEKGDQIEGTDQIKKYYHFIEWDTKKNMLFKDNHYFLGVKKIEKYKFNSAFYFVTGDNSEKAYDSRKFGMIPDKDIVAKVVFKLW